LAPAVWRVCNDGSVTSESDEQARKEAGGYPVSAPDADMLRGESSRKAAGLGPDGNPVRAVFTCCGPEPQRVRWR
jgi:hypothetical protein